MTISEFRAITTADIPAMTNLLISRQILESDTFPFLQNRCLNTKYGMDALEKLFMSSTVTGAGAFVENELAGYIMGEIKVDPSRGRHAWVPYEGMAVRADQSPELIRTLYEKVCTAWLKQGCFMHYVIVPLGNQAYFEAFQRLSFFIQQVHGVMNLEEYRPFAHVPDIKVRIAGKADREKMGRMSGIIQSYQNSAPTFELVLPEVEADIKAGYERTVEDGDMTVLLAEKDGEELGFQIYEAAASGLMSPDGGAELSVAGTYPCRMGTGVGKKLMNEGCSLMRERGVRHIIADWRITNLASSTFWPKCGFKPAAYRMVRYIDSSWTWAGFDHLDIQ
ncbi:acetyltransferase (GNAT) family protein [Oxobacter pfennigii]|uniref:Acetyltransferase (GNAT) family protein n=2 Tax=Oxobacter pfennigii TaxID=36849 RepID=A0A0P8Y8U1_9CLOT|nr:acetyltransferase (GNAT) family protein [Oxobacter pfennigii]